MSKSELHLKYRPKALEDMVGQRSAISVVLNKLSSNTLPHVCLFHGPSGTGKTTLARIIATELGASGSDIQETNCADVRGIDTVREIRDNMGYAPMGGKARVWILDEVVQLPKATQQAFLKILEDTPAHAYFMLCSSDISGLIPTFLGRCFLIRLESLTVVELQKIVVKVLRLENVFISTTVEQGVCKSANGSARMVLQLLEAALSVEGEEEQLEAIGVSAVQGEEKIEFLAKALLRKAPWHTVVKVISAIKEQDVESVRRQVLAYANKVMLNPKVTDSTGLAYLIIQAFQTPWHQVGCAGLTAACWECIQGK